MRTSQINSFKSNFIAIGWHFSALFVINSLLMGLDCNKQLRHYCTRAYYKEYAFFSLAKIYLNLLKSIKILQRVVPFYYNRERREIKDPRKWDSRTSRYVRLSNTDTSPLRATSNVSTKFSYIFFKKTSIIRTLDTDNGH